MFSPAMISSFLNSYSILRTSAVISTILSLKVHRMKEFESTLDEGGYSKIHLQGAESCSPYTSTGAMVIDGVSLKRWNIQFSHIQEEPILKF